MKTLAAIGGAAMMAMAIVSPASAQDQPVGGTGPSTGSVVDQASPTRGAATRLQTPQANENRGRNRERARTAAPVAPTPEENIVAAQAIATTAAPSCQVSQANFLGQTAEGAKSYEAACATGPGYILIGSTPPQAVDCVLLAGQAEIDRARDPAADVGTQCAIPQNADVLRVLRAYATQAGVPCTVDQGASIGKSSEGNLIYEIGCSGVDGYWLEQVGTGWKTTECAIVTTQNATCRYTTSAEAAASFKTRLAGSEAAACDVTEGRYMGANANGAFWEAKCSAGNGVIVRFNPEYAVQQVYPCETAQRIGGGCRLTIVPEAPAAPAPAAEQ
ncbi:hypothetical protein [Brevundimonas sp.]|uniref:hypothetical protein n=1 Tax=Brevundimonas sp. TaxID=1871086 RepID=UPI003D14C926